MDIVKAKAEDAGALTKIALAAKAHWGYPEHWIKQWKDELTITSSYVETHHIYAAVTELRFVGFFAITLQKNAASLDHLWVLPAAMGKGIGRALFEQAENVARDIGAKSLKITSDPHAESFYLRMGAVTYGQEPATMNGQERSLPLMEKELSPAPR